MAIVSIRYARAFADVLLQHGLDAARCLNEVNEAREMLRSSDGLRRVLENPSISLEQKSNLLAALAQRAAWAPETLHFLAVVTEHRRISMLPEIARRLQLELDRRMGITEAEITVSRPLPPEEQHDLELHISRTAGGRGVRATYRTDPAILGGAIVRIGSTIYDGSVKGQLRKIRESLSSA
ncbi:MAG: ATP synthase F1 subunit delta [Acidobacteria bacterium]|nr:ATP synthase F1 subunit delta [Acidobacteriota bacterium]